MTTSSSTATMFSARRNREAAARVTVSGAEAVASTVQPRTRSAALSGCKRNPRTKRHPNTMNHRSAAGAPSNTARAHCSAVRGAVLVDGVERPGETARVNAKADA